MMELEIGLDLKSEILQNLSREEWFVRDWTSKKIFVLQASPFK
jgi:hypothetical protein